MYYDLPSTGCNISNTSGYIDNYYNGTRRRYLLGEDGKLVLVYQTSYSTTPSGYTCLNDSSISYRSDLVFWFQVVAVVAVVAIFIGILKATRLLK